MPTSSDQGLVPSARPVATAAADPVLIHLRLGRTHIALLAQDMTYDKAGLMRLHNVRWSRRGAGFLARIREPANLVVNEVRVRNVGGQYIATVPGAGNLITGGAADSMRLINLTALHYQSLRTATPRRLHQALLERRPTATLRRVRTIAHTLRTVATVLTAKLAAAW